MRKKIAYVMDDPFLFHPEKDTTLGLIIEGEKRDHLTYYISIDNLFLKGTNPYAKAKEFSYKEGKFLIKKEYEELNLDEFDFVLMRKDPPFDMRFFFAVQLLCLCKNAKVINRPTSLLEANEKLFTLQFPGIFPNTIVTSDRDIIHDFMNQHENGVILKPLDGCGGQGIVFLKSGDMNFNSLVEMSTDEGKDYVMVQKYLPEVRKGDKRVICIQGEAKIALARIPANNEHRANIHVGGTTEVQELTERDQWLVDQVKTTLIEKGLFFVGLDIIGDYVTEINVTSPTGIREIKQFAGIDLAKDFWDKIDSFH